MDVLFKGVSDDAESLACIVRALSDVHEMEMRGWSHVPSLQEAGVVYKPERSRIGLGAGGRTHLETMLGAGELLDVQEADCEELAAYLAAWLRIRGHDDALTDLVVVSPQLLHAVVAGDGWVMDPSLLCGMPADAAYTADALAHAVSMAARSPRTAVEGVGGLREWVTEAVRTVATAAARGNPLAVATVTAAGDLLGKVEGRQLMELVRAFL